MFSLKEIECLRSLIPSLLTLSLLSGGCHAVSAQGKSSDFYSTYDVKVLVEGGGYKGIEFTDGDMGVETETESSGGGSEKSKSVTYGCKVETGGGNKFDLVAFLKWLAGKTEGQIKGGKGSVVRQEHGEGGFRIEYAEGGYKGSVDVKAEAGSKDRLSLEVEVSESLEE